MTGAGLVFPAVTVLAVSGVLSPFLQPESQPVEEGFRRYREGDWVGAVERFRAAVERSPRADLQVNLGAAAYQGQNYPEAIRAFGSAAGSPELPPGRAAYDLGNALYRNQDLEEALEAYRQALREDPANEDARFNYELTLRQLSDQEQQQDEQQQQQQQDQNQSQEQDPSSESEQNQDASPPDSTGGPPRDSEPGDDSREQPEPGEEGEPEQDRQSASEEQPQQMLSPEEAQRLLNAVSPEERELIRARLKAGRRRVVEKDW